MRLPIRFFAGCLTLGLLSAPASSEEAIFLSPGTTVDLSGTIVPDQGVVSDDQAGAVVEISTETVPASSDLNAYDRNAEGSSFFSLDTGAEFGGATTATAGDVLRFDGETVALEYDASEQGLPAGVMVDAVTELEPGVLLLSFDTTAQLGDDLTVSDEDLVRFNGTASYSLFFDGSAQGVPEGLDLDGAAYAPDEDRLFLSFDAGGSIGDVHFADEDILAFDRSTSTFSLFYDGSALHAGWDGADVDAVALAAPEAGAALGTTTALGALLWLHACRRRNASNNA